ncbi:histidine phosphatase family protein [Microbacterium oleivorans]|uniref:Histidine phosphatase family protein n=1 Tax=Microbacterium oleivorans TaxID=273677 RepID=A0A7D5EWY5_9MICO|nr:histidine phosphatase family protein [Microbacterium oleivorans]QLD11684.1 histidine phosphatase family protein [Microbacterium oleivorans]
MTLALVRHGRTAWNRERRMQGRSDLVLDGVGEEQAAAAGRILSGAVWARIVSSPLRRAVQSAEIIGAHLPGIRHERRSDLVERDYGQAEGRLVAEARENWPDEGYPGAESIDATRERGAGALRDLLRQGENTVVVAHGTVLRLAVEALTGSPCPRILNGEVILVEAGAMGELRARRLSG